MHNFFLHKNILIFRRFFNSANRFKYLIFHCMSIVLPLYTKKHCYLNIANAFSMIGAMS